VMVAKGGDRLLEEEAVFAVRTVLLRLARVVTPNVPEAEVLADMEVRSHADAREAARRILKLGPAAVLVKGGHLPGDTITDLLVDRSGEVEISGPRILGPYTHGTGCTLAAGIAARLALGDDLEAAARHARAFVTAAMQHGVDRGAGHKPLGHFWERA
jgi:hydroxymethylpyrimidine/phosphomethylpyrimidine kinase